jgi:5'-deoxynucleotidase YfbR-like HD superfamily hydrolase
MSIHDIVVEDIVHALSNITRFGGHLSHFYSVAQHSVLVSNILEMNLRSGKWSEPNMPKEYVLLWGLLHDAAEAYLGDIPKPVKGSILVNTGEQPEDIFIQKFEAVEAHIMSLVTRKFGLPVDMPKVVKLADRAALQAEALTFKSNTPGHIWREFSDDLYGFPVKPLNPQEARVAFWNRLREIKETRK